MRTSAAPRQRCSPKPNARCGGFDRDGSSNSPAVGPNAASSRLPGRVEHHEVVEPLRPRHAADLGVGGHRAAERLDRRDPAQALLDRARDRAPGRRPARRADRGARTARACRPRSGARRLVAGDEQREQEDRAARRGRAGGRRSPRSRGSTRCRRPGFACFASRCAVEEQEELADRGRRSPRRACRTSRSWRPTSGGSRDGRRRGCRAAPRSRAPGTARRPARRSRTRPVRRARRARPRASSRMRGLQRRDRRAA